MNYKTLKGIQNCFEQFGAYVGEDEELVSSKDCPNLFYKRKKPTKDYTKCGFKIEEKTDGKNDIKTAE